MTMVGVGQGVSSGILAGGIDPCEPTTNVASELGLMVAAEPKSQMTRTRYLELAAIAKHICDALHKMGVQRHEGCEFNQIATRLWNLA